MAKQPKVLRFTRRAEGEDIPDDDATVAELKRARKFFKPGDLVPQSVWQSANSILAERSRALSFSAHRSYIESMRQVLHTDPYLSLGIGPYLYDDQFDNVKFLDAEAREDDDAA